MFNLWHSNNWKPGTWITPTNQKELYVDSARYTEWGVCSASELSSLSTCGPEIDVQGKGVSISSGDTIPSTVDDTDFGNRTVGTALQHTFTIYNNGDSDLVLSGIPKVVVSGANSGDFVVAPQPSSPIGGPGGWSSFIVTFTPSSARFAYC